MQKTRKLSNLIDSELRFEYHIKNVAIFFFCAKTKAWALEPIAAYNDIFSRSIQVIQVKFYGFRCNFEIPCLRLCFNLPQSHVTFLRICSTERSQRSKFGFSCSWLLSLLWSRGFHSRQDHNDDLSCDEQEWTHILKWRSQATGTSWKPATWHFAIRFDIEQGIILVKIQEYKQNVYLNDNISSCILVILCLSFQHLTSLLSFLINLHECYIIICTKYSMYVITLLPKLAHRGHDNKISE